MRRVHLLQLATLTVLGLSTVSASLNRGFDDDLAIRGGEGTATMVFVSDLHYDSFYGTTNSFCGPTTPARPALGMFGCDSPKALIDSAFGDIAQQDADYLVSGGDWERHMAGALTDAENLAQFRYVTGAAVNATKAWSRTANGTHRAMVFPSLFNASLAFGNNDFVPDYNFNYTSVNRTPLYTAMTGALLSERLLNPEEHRTFHSCGYYSRLVGQQRLRIVVLNTLIWSRSLQPQEATGADPCGQFAFLKAQVTAARSAGQAVWIVSHIPPTINYHYVETRSDPVLDSSRFLQAGYEATFLAILTSGNDVIRAMVFGHTHHVAFTGDANVGIPLFVLGAVTPIYYNWPNYMLATVNTTTWAINDLQQRYLDQATSTWQDGLRLASAFQYPAGLGCESFVGQVECLRAVAAQLQTNATAWNTWRVLTAGGTLEDQCTTAHCRDVIACLTSALGPDATFACLGTTPAPSTV